MKKTILIIALFLLGFIVLGVFAMAFNVHKLFFRAADKVSNFFDDLIPDKKPEETETINTEDTEEERPGIVCAGAETTPGFSKLYPAT